MSAFPALSPSLVLRHGALPAGDEPFVVAGMFTASHAATADRLLASLRRLGLPHALFEVPTVHRSISPKGTPDPVYTKANFLAHVLALARRPVLYVDVDTVFRQPPELLPRLLAAGHDFAITNWLGADPNDAWVPVHVGPPPADGAKAAPRFFRFSHAIDLVDPEQLICSGAVQLWGVTPATDGLLAAWHQAILDHPGVADDQCLDFAFNNPSGEWRAALRPSWLPRAYARYAFWLLDQPVIDHPDFPYAGGDWREIPDTVASKRVYPERARERDAKPRVRRDALIDTQTGDLLKIEAKRLVRLGRLPVKAWPPGAAK
jgi:hypothetical protein